MSAVQTMPGVWTTLPAVTNVLLRLNLNPFCSDLYIEIAFLAPANFHCMDALHPSLAEGPGNLPASSPRILQKGSTVVQPVFWTIIKFPAVRRCRLRMRFPTVQSAFGEG
jgi:hypothetical protein